MSNRFRAAAVMFVCALFCASAASAFDGERKGFVLGFSIGPSITSFTQKLEYQNEKIESDRENKFGLGTDFRIGYAPSNRMMIYYTNKVNWFSLENALGDNEIFISGVGLLGVSYYLEPTHPSLYMTGTIGMSTWGLMDEMGDAWSGFGLGAGIGYEFAQHYSTEAVVMWGKPGDTIEGVDASTNALGIMITIGGTLY